MEIEIREKRRKDVVPLESLSKFVVTAAKKKKKKSEEIRNDTSIKKERELHILPALVVQK